MRSGRCRACMEAADRGCDQNAGPWQRIRYNLAELQHPADYIATQRASASVPCFLVRGPAPAVYRRWDRRNHRWTYHPQHDLRLENTGYATAIQPLRMAWVDHRDDPATFSAMPTPTPPPPTIDIAAPEPKPAPALDEPSTPEPVEVEDVPLAIEMAEPPSVEPQQETVRELHQEAKAEPEAVADTQVPQPDPAIIPSQDVAPPSIQEDLAAGPVEASPQTTAIVVAEDRTRATERDIVGAFVLGGRGFQQSPARPQVVVKQSAVSRFLTAVKLRRNASPRR